MFPLSRFLLASIGLATTVWSTAATAFDVEQLHGRWCLSAVSAVDGDRARSIGREWTFLRGGLLRIQSEASADVRMRVGYSLSDRRLAIDELDLRLEIERISERRMAALGRGGGLRYHFERGVCSEAGDDTDTETGTGAQGESDTDARDDPGGGDGDNRPVR